MNLNFIDNIILPNWIEKYDVEIINYLKRNAQAQGRMLKKYKNPDYILRRSIEIAKSTPQKDLDSIQKLIFVSNAVLTEDDAFLNSMTHYGWSKEKNERLNNLLLKIKIFKKKNMDINFDISLIEEINQISIRCFGINNPAVLINRLNELSITKKNFLETVKTKKY